MWVSLTPSSPFLKSRFFTSVNFKCDSDDWLKVYHIVANFLLFQKSFFNTVFYDFTSAKRYSRCKQTYFWGKKGFVFW